MDQTPLYTGREFHVAIAAAAIGGGLGWGVARTSPALTECVGMGYLAAFWVLALYRAWRDRGAPVRPASLGYPAANFALVGTLLLVLASPLAWTVPQVMLAACVGMASVHAVVELALHALRRLRSRAGDGGS